MSSVNSRYHQDVLDVLAKCRRAESIEDIRGFLIEKKDEAFFD